MHAVKTLLFLYLAKCITANATTVRRVQQEAVAACQKLTSSSTSDGTTTTISEFPDPSCWEILDMADWMTEWNATTTVCNANQSPLTPCQCLMDEPWATCFMRLTYQRNRTASYLCTDLMESENCTMPVLGNVVPGPAEIFYGAYSIWSLFRYLKVWHTSLTAPTAVPAITTELSKTKTSALSANNLLAALIQDYAVDEDLGQTLASIVTSEPIVSANDSPTRPTQSNAQALLGQLLQQVLDVLTSNWACGDFQAMAKGGMLLNSSVETTKFLTGRLDEQKKM